MNCPKCRSENPADSSFCGKCGMLIHSIEKDALTSTQTLQTHILELATGTSFAGRYRVIEEIGRGGMGKVYKVLDEEIDEKVALKLLRPEIAADEDMINRFRNELRLARQISHKNVCGMYHLGKAEGTYYITMEYVPGEDLKSLIRRIGHMPIRKSLFIAKQICEGLGEAHLLGVVHRDLKPRNIMIDREGNVRIMDFGIARSLKTKGKTEAGMVIGTPEYLSPEQAEGNEADHRSDIYSLGVILYEMMTGRVPFEGDTAFSVALKHVTETPPDPKEFNDQISEEMCRVIQKCMEKDRERRYQTARDLFCALTGLEKGTPAKEKSVSGEEKGKGLGPDAPPRRKTGYKWAGALFLTALLVLAGYHVRKRFMHPADSSENYILLDLSAEEAPGSQENLVEYLLLRSLTAATNSDIFVRDDYALYKKRTETSQEKLTIKNPLLVITAEVHPQVTGFEILISVGSKARKTHTQKFECKGNRDLLTGTIDKIHSFISAQSGGVIGQRERGAPFTQICTSNLDALIHFLKGEAAWNKLDSDEASFEYRTAIENDPDFSLARIKLADVLIFRGDRPEANKNLQLALEKKDRLIEYDLFRLRALEARLNSQPAEERQYIGRLAEAFPLKKEYYYELGESYFHCGDAEEAIRLYTRALELDPDYALAHNHIAFCYAWSGNHKLAEEHFKKYVQLDNTANSFDSLATGYMFAGKYDDAIKTLDMGRNLNPALDYLYENMARNLILKGQLSRALSSIQQEESITSRETTKINIHFLLAYIEFSRGNLDKASAELRVARDSYSREPYKDRIDESPNLPFWLTGVIAARRGDLPGLKEMVSILQHKIAKNRVNPTNYFPVYKLYIHLRALEGWLENDPETVRRNVEEGQRIKDKMGYWTSMFNRCFFLNGYAEILINLKEFPEAMSLLSQVIDYNPRYAPVHINLAYVRMLDHKSGVREECQKAKDLLQGADGDFVSFSEIRKIEKTFN